MGAPRTRACGVLPRPLNARLNRQQRFVPLGQGVQQQFIFGRVLAGGQVLPHKVFDDRGELVGHGFGSSCLSTLR
jgi:hypothetical protein